MPVASNTNRFKRSSNSGYTLVEILVVVTAIGVLAILGIPSWLAFVETSRLNTAQDQVYWAMRQAQSQAIKEKLTKQVSLRENNGILQLTVHQADTENFIPDVVNNNNQIWYSLYPTIHIDQQRNNKDKYETTFPKQSSQQVWRVLFNYQGCPVYTVDDECTNTSLRTLGQLTLFSRNASNVRRCVYISTIIGAMKKGKNNTRANTNDKYCY